MINDLGPMTRPAESTPSLAGGITFAFQPSIRTPRLHLRKPEDSDAAALAVGLQNFSVVRMLMRVPQPYDIADARDWISHWHRGETPGWAFVVVGENGAPIGVVSVRSKGCSELGYWLMPDYWQQGLMSEAVNAVIERFFAASIGEMLFSNVMADNPASLKLQARLGFAVTGAKDAWCPSRAAMVTLLTTELTFGGFTPL